jgi:hypothetical protein
MHFFTIIFLIYKNEVEKIIKKISSRNGPMRGS